MKVFQPLLTVALLCCAAGVARGQANSFSFEDGVVDARCPKNDNPMSPALLSVPNDCSKFQKCFQGRAFTLSCPAGQEFGVQLQRCDYPAFAKCRQGFVQPQPAAFRYEEGRSDTRCPRFDDPFNPSHLAHPTDCRRFYKCFDGRAFELECPEGQEWGSALGRCDYPFLARCTASREDRQDANEESPADLAASVESVNEEKDAFVVQAARKHVRPAKAEFTYSAGVIDVRCPKFDDPFRPIHIAHPNDCRKFQKCFDGRAYTIDCPPGQEFGQRINRCDYPQFAQCSQPKASRKSLRKAAAPVYDDSYYYDDDAGNDVPLDSAEWTPEQREMIAGMPDMRCPDKDDPTEPIHFTHPRDCGKFYKCYSGRIFLINCPIGQHWSVRYDRCDYPKVAKCTIRGS